MANKKEGKKITIDALAGMVARGFEHMEQRFARGFEHMEQRFDGLATDVAVLKTNMAVLQTTVNRIDIRTQNQVDAVYEETAVLKSDMKTAKKDIVRIKAHVGLAA
ncbi:MAG: hypothetical protein AAB547_01295 [Patescibacteria group bacterium]